MCGVEGYCFQLKTILIYLRNNLPHRFLKENVFVTMHHMPFTIPADLCYALVLLHSRHQYWQLIANFIPHYPLSNIPYFPQPHPIFCHHIHKYLRQRYMPSAQVEPRFNNLAHARSAHLSRLMRLARQPLSLLMFLSPQRLWSSHVYHFSELRQHHPHYQLHQHDLASLLTKQHSNPVPLLFARASVCAFAASLDLTSVCTRFNPPCPRITTTYSLARHRLPT